MVARLWAWVAGIALIALLVLFVWECLFRRQFTLREYIAGTLYAVYMAIFAVVGSILSPLYLV